MTESAIFDEAEALIRVDNDRELLSELVGIFFEDYPNQRVALSEAAAAAEGSLLESAAHSLKSALGNLGAMRAYHKASEIEKAGREGALDSISELCKELEKEIEEFQQTFQVFQAKSG